jgi:hypothetical protein
MEEAGEQRDESQEDEGEGLYLFVATPIEGTRSFLLEDCASDSRTHLSTIANKQIDIFKYFDDQFNRKDITGLRSTVAVFRLPASPTTLPRNPSSTIPLPPTTAGLIGSAQPLPAAGYADVGATRGPQCPFPAPPSASHILPVRWHLTPVALCTSRGFEDTSRPSTKSISSGTLLRRDLAGF